MSIYIPECNENLQATGTPVALALPATSSSKGANTGSVTAFWLRTPNIGYDDNRTRVILSRANGDVGGGDGFIAMNQGCTTLSARWRNTGVDYVGTTGMSITTAPGKTYLVMLIVTAANVHLVACEPGGSPIVSTTSSAAFYGLNVTGNTWDRVCVIGATGGVYAHYGPVEELCFWTGLFPEASNIPDNTLIANIASGAQDLATLHSSLTSGVKKFRYRMLTTDDLTDSFAVASSLTATNTGTDKVLMSSGPLRPVALAPAWSQACASQLTFPTPGSTTGATAVIKTPAGTYSGISPAAIQARLIKEDRSVLTTWETVATPSGGTWAEGRFAAAQPYTAGWLEIQFKAVDGGGAQLGDIVSAYGLAGTGVFLLTESQSQLIYFFDQGNGVSIPSTVRLTTAHFVGGGAQSSHRRINSDNLNTRIAYGARQAAVEIDAQFPRMPVTLAAVGVIGQTIEQFLLGGTYYGNWANLKALLGVTQPYFLTMYGHSTVSGSPSTATYEGLIGNIRTTCESFFGAAVKFILCPTARYAGAASTGDYTSSNLVRTAIRDYVIHNPTTAVLGGSWATVKNDASDVGPHPADLAVGQGRAGSYLAYAALMACRAVKQQPLQIKSATPSGTTVRLKFGPVNTL